MALKDALLPEFDHEMANTRRTLERVPEDRFDWRPHEKSPAMGWLAAHLANIPSWCTYTLQQDSLDLAPGGQEQRFHSAASLKEVLESFDTNVAAARQVIGNTSDEQFAVPWTLLKAGQTIFSMPRAAILRSFVLNHIVHHRGQLTVYLRLNNIPVPALYGRSADESAF
ncbi:MAG: DinB family protein [Bryobacterales bacterium]|nr:DinB family protein [Bryobacterales bacterium]MEB2363159.1 DinB family protein [Bryobacterales bacterium]